MEVEIWKRIPGHEEYEVSDLGRVRYNYGDTRYLLSQHNHTTVHLLKRNLKVRSRVDLIVLSAFVCPKFDNLQVVHKDGDMCNNKLDNLTWSR